SMAAQERLLRVVEYGEVTRIGASRPLSVDVRIVGATNEHLPHAAQEHRFRADLLDRLSFDVITLPPLRAREGDVAVLADYFGRRMASEIGWSGWPGFSGAVLAQLETHDWPGNVRELRNVVERAVYRWMDETQPVGGIALDPFASPWAPVPTGGRAAAGGPRAEASSPPAAPPIASPLPSASSAIPEGGDLRGAVAAYERALIEQALTRHRHNQRATAKALGLSYDQLRHCMKKYGLPR
ncbi:MAG: AAA family ATPase, partial [Sphingobium sp. 32-64-5]